MPLLIKTVLVFLPLFPHQHLLFDVGLGLMQIGFILSVFLDGRHLFKVVPAPERGVMTPLVFKVIYDTVIQGLFFQMVGELTLGLGGGL